MPSFEYVRRALREINTHHDNDFELVDKAAGGMNDGAWFVANAEDQRAVLKIGVGWSLDHLRRAERAVQKVRASGYPTPEWKAVGTLQDGTRYQLQEFLDGEPGDPLTVDKAKQLVELIEQHKGLDPWPERDWNTHVYEDINDVIARVRAKVPQASDLMDLFARVPRVHLPPGDLVHGDLNSCNVLMRDGHILGAIDIEALGSGSRVIDYAWLLREAYAEACADPEIRRIIRTAGERVAGEEAFAMCIVQTSCGLVLWMAERLPNSVPEILPGLHNLADDIGA